MAEKRKREEAPVALAKLSDISVATGDAGVVCNIGPLSSGSDGEGVRRWFLASERSIRPPETPLPLLRSHEQCNTVLAS
jgi:hypothetical protein